ncbi:MAG: hypothetical protein K2X60_06455 [Xanthobacteraceae bacterium]|nr:hypothetical protein [Xanthobacteraceae bacterium]
MADSRLDIGETYSRPRELPLMLRASMAASDNQVHEGSQMKKENNLPGRQDQGGKQGGQKDGPKPSPQPDKEDLDPHHKGPERQDNKIR